MPTFSNTQTFGINQTSLILKTAIEMAIQDIRAKPYLLDYCFASLVQDTLTNQQYGQKEIQNAKDFFLKQEIPVFFHHHMNGIQMPCISIKLLSTAEAEVTLGDVNYISQEDADIQWPPLVAQFDPILYDPITGYLTLPPTVSQQLYLSVYQLIIDRLGNTYPILAVKSATLIQIQSGLTVDLTGLVIKGQRPSYAATLESVEFREVYSIGCHAENEPIKMVYLFSIVMFILLAYKQIFLEARNFERTVLSASDEQINEMFGKELVYSRYVQITGYSRNYWPKLIASKVTGVDTQIIVESNTNPQIDLSNQIWTVEAETEESNDND